MERPTRDTDSSVTVSDRLCCSCIGLKRFGGGWEAGRVSSRGSRSIASGQEHEGGMRSGAHKSWVKTTELPGAMPGPGQCPLTNTKTIA
jgi:hypothetical protein